MRISSHSTKTTLVPFSTMLNNEWRLVMGFPLGFLPLEHLFVCLFTGILLHHATLIQENLTKKKKNSSYPREAEGQSRSIAAFSLPIHYPANAASTPTFINSSIITETWHLLFQLFCKGSGLPLLSVNLSTGAIISSTWISIPKLGRNTPNFQEGIYNAILLSMTPKLTQLEKRSLSLVSGLKSLDCHDT